MGIGAGASVVGGTMQMIAAAQAARAMQQAFEREQTKQSGFQNQALGAFQPEVQQRGVETAREQIAQGSQNRQNFYGQLASAPLALGSGPSARDRAAYSLAGTARGNLGGYSDWALQQMIHGIRTQDVLNKISNFAGGEAKVFPYRMYDAQHSADQLAAIGNLISSIGGTAGSWTSLMSGGYPTGGGQMPQYQFQPPTYGLPQGNQQDRNAGLGGNAYD